MENKEQIENLPSLNMGVFGMREKEKAVPGQEQSQSADSSAEKK